MDDIDDILFNDDEEDVYVEDEPGDYDDEYDLSQDEEHESSEEDNLEESEESELDALEDGVLEDDEEEDDEEAENVGAELYGDQDELPSIPADAFQKKPTGMDLPDDSLVKILQSYFKKYGMVRHQIESYDKFMFVTLPQIVEEFSKINVRSTDSQQRHEITLKNLKVNSPATSEKDTMLYGLDPSDAELRRLTYAAGVVVDVEHLIYRCHPDKPEELLSATLYQEMLLCKIPIMIGSSFCRTRTHPPKRSSPFEEAGHFVINGHLKVVVPQEKMRSNWVCCTATNKKDAKNVVYSAEVRSWNEKKFRSSSTLNIHLTRNRTGAFRVTVEIPFLKNCKIPLYSMLRMLEIPRQEMFGYVSNFQTNLDDDVSYYIASLLNDEYEDKSLDELYAYFGAKSTDATKDTLKKAPDGNKRKKEPRKKSALDVERANKRAAQLLVQSEVLPHIGLISQDNYDEEEARKIKQKRAFFIGHIVQRLLLVALGKQDEDNRDHIGNKYLECPGFLLALLFRQLMRRMIKRFEVVVRFSMDKHNGVEIMKALQHKLITKPIRTALATGNWTVDKRSDGMNGVSQMLSTLNDLAALSHKRRINVTLNRKGKITKPRQVDLSHWGLIDPAESKSEPVKASTKFDCN